jgi:hypothetical protein
LPRLRYKKLYTQSGSRVFFPLWAFNHKLVEKIWERSLEQKFVYTWTPTDEQSKVIDEIKMFSYRTGLIEMKTW